MTEAAKWEWKEPEDKTCWKDLVVFNAAECADAAKQADQTDVPATLATGKFGGKTYLKSCSGTEIVVTNGADETAAKAADAAEVKVPYTHDKGKASCVAWGTDKWASWTAVGWAEAKNDSNSTNATGAKSLAAAMAAGALAVAATQF